MPHKHKRKRTDSTNQTDLPPTSKAAPLPTSLRSRKHTTSNTNNKSNNKPHSKPHAKSSAQSAQENDRPPKRQKRSKDPNDDAPREFKMLMARMAGKTIRRGPDEGEKPRSAKSKRAGGGAKQVGDGGDTTKAATGLENVTSTTKKAENQTPKLKPLPGERLRDFNARVDQMMPVLTHGRIGGVKSRREIEALGIKGLKERQTRSEKKIQRMQAAWKREDERLRERAEEERERVEEENALKSDDDDGVSASAGAALHWDGGAMPGGKKKRKRAMGHVGGGLGVGADDDPWAGLMKERGKRAGVNDVVQEPPRLKGVRSAPSKVKGVGGAKVEVGNVPSAAGSLRRREELADVRRDVVEEYRKRMGRS